MVVDSGPESDPEADSDLRRRAAWLLAMLAAVAVLFVIVMSQLGTADKPSHGNGPRALDSVVGQPSASTSTHSTHSSTPSGSHSSPGSSPAGSTPAETTTCPTQQACILQGDPGHGIAAINAYRTQHGRGVVAGRVSKKAQQCALNNGSGCSGGWAETQLGQLEGPAAVQKILPFAHLLDSFKAVQVGWAFDPRAHQYYFAIIRTD